MKKLKGQSLIFEQVLLFSIAVVIFIVSFAVFNIYQDFFLGVNSDNQLDESKEWIASNILKVAEQSNDTTSILILPLPKEIGNAVYDIQLDNEGLVVKNLLNDNTKTSTLYTLNETYTLSGNLTSLNGKLIIKKEDKQIIIS